MADLQQEEFVEGYVRHLEELLESYLAYINAVEKLLTEGQKRRLDHASSKRI